MLEKDNPASHCIGQVAVHTPIPGGEGHRWVCLLQLRFLTRPSCGGQNLAVWGWHVSTTRLSAHTVGILTVRHQLTVFTDYSYRIFIKCKAAISYTDFQRES